MPHIPFLAGFSVCQSFVAILFLGKPALTSLLGLGAASGNSLVSREQTKKSSGAELETSLGSGQAANGTSGNKRESVGERPAPAGRTRWAWLTSLQTPVARANSKISKASAKEASTPRTDSGSSPLAVPSNDRAGQDSKSEAEKIPTATISPPEPAKSQAVNVNGRTANLSKPSERDFIPLGRSNAAIGQRSARTNVKGTAGKAAVPSSGPESSDRLEERQTSSEAMRRARLTSGSARHDDLPGMARSPPAANGNRGTRAEVGSTPRRQSSSPSNPAWNSPAHFAKCKQRLLTDIHSPNPERARSGSIELQKAAVSSQPGPPESIATAAAVSPGGGMTSPSSPGPLQSRASRETYVGLPKVASPPTALGIWKKDDPSANARQTSADPLLATAAVPANTAETVPADTLGNGICMPPGNWGSVRRLAAKENLQSNGMVRSKGLRM